MSDDQEICSRRRILGAIIAGLPVAIAFRSESVSASDKMTKPQAEYRDTPNGIYSCGLCSLFEAPAACKVVEGEISRDGWCKAFALQD